MELFYYNNNFERILLKIFGLRIFKHNVDYSAKVMKNHQTVLKQLQEKFGKKKIRVGFLVSECAKWQYQQLYDELEKNENFEPSILITELTTVHNGKDKYRNTFAQCYDFFSSLGLRTQKAYDIENNKYIPLSSLGIDIIFYQQPWDLATIQHPARVSKYALTCYVPYGLHLMENSVIYKMGFHNLLWRMFIEDKGQLSHIRKLTKKEPNNCLYIGYPKLDEYFAVKPLLKKEKPTIIYAPHHSFEKHSLACATFRENGIDILHLAQKYHYKINWIFKPHPRFKYAVISNNVMREDEIASYYDEWRKIGSVFEGGDYINLFVNSDALVTDSISFLGEYLPSQHPIFHLISPLARFNDFAKSFIDSFYQIHNSSELEQELKNVVFNGIDRKKEERLSKIKILFDENETSTSKIINSLIQTLGRE